jgi:hypothetical protein
VEVSTGDADLWRVGRTRLHSAGTTPNPDPLCHLALSGDILLRNPGSTPSPQRRYPKRQTQQLDVTLSFFNSNTIWTVLCAKGKALTCLAIALVALSIRAGLTF